MKDKLFAHIGKYALLLSIFQVLSLALSRAAIEFEFGDHLRISSSLRQMTPYLFSFLLNLVMAYIVDQDIRKHDIKTKYVTLATIVYRPLGVFAFLLYLFLQDAPKGSKEIRR